MANDGTVPHNRNLQKHYAPGSPDRKALEDALASIKQKAPLTVPLVVAGNEVTMCCTRDPCAKANQQPYFAQIKSSQTFTQSNPSTHASLATYSHASKADVESAISAALAARKCWAATTFAERASIFLKAADLIATKYRYDIMALTMHGQGKNAWQAEIDSAAELCDFFRFGVKYAEELYAQQPVHHAPGVWK